VVDDPPSPLLDAAVPAASLGVEVSEAPSVPEAAAELFELVDFRLSVL
jgi:hypothetical protein